MSMAIVVFLNKSDLPTISVWQDAVNQLGYDYLFDPNWNLVDGSGAWPGSLNGQRTAFEYAFADEDDERPSLAKSYSSSVSFFCHGDFVEAAAAWIAATALAATVPSVLYDTEANEAYTGPEAIAYAQPILTQMQALAKHYNR